MERADRCLCCFAERGQGGVAAVAIRWERNRCYRDKLRVIRREDPREGVDVVSSVPALAVRLREEGAITDGMLPKSSAIEAAIRGGVRRVHVISYAETDSLLAEIFTNEGKGTLVVADTKALTAAEQGQ